MRNEATSDLIETIAAKAIRLRLEAPLAFFLEAHLPLTTLAQHAGLLLEPAMTPLFGAERLGNFKTLFSDRDNIEYLLSLLQQPSSLTQKQGG